MHSWAASSALYVPTAHGTGVLNMGVVEEEKAGEGVVEEGGVVEEAGVLHATSPSLLILPSGH